MSAGWVFKSVVIDEAQYAIEVPLGSVIIDMDVVDDRLKVLYRCKTSALKLWQDDGRSSESHRFRYIDEDETVSVADMNRLRYIRHTDRFGGIKFLYEEMPAE